MHDSLNLLLCFLWMTKIIVLYIFKYANILIFQSSIIEDVVFEDFFTDHEEELEAEQDDNDFCDYGLVCIVVQFFSCNKISKTIHSLKI